MPIVELGVNMSTAGSPPGSRPHTKPQRVLVSGATGYAGDRLVPSMLVSGHDASVLTRNPEKLRGLPWCPSVPAHQRDATDSFTLAPTFAGVETRRGQTDNVSRGITNPDPLYKGITDLSPELRTVNNMTSPNQKNPDSGEILPEPKIDRDHTYQPISDQDRAEYEADVDHVLSNDVDRDGDVDFLDSVKRGLMKVKNIMSDKGAHKIAEVIDKMDGDGPITPPTSER
jgi:hypothetical protein